MVDDEYKQLISSLLARTGGWKQLPRLKEELESWRPFWSSLRKDDREVFQRALVSIWDYAEAIESSSQEDMSSTEAFLLSVILSQQKMLDRINERAESKTGC
ncbi:MAG: hypothetical protein ACYC7D_03600 [Nitrososphaerales archaeon]